MKNLLCSLKKNGKQIIALFAMLCFIIGNAAFVPAVEANAATATIKSVINPPDFYVDNGTREVTLQKLLPKQVDVVLSNGTKSKADVTWNTKGYVSNVKTSYTFTFTGTVKGTKLTAKIKVILANPFVTSIKTPEPISVANGTTVDKLNLPKTVTVVKSDKTTASAKVVWDTSKYNGKVLKETEYVFTGDVEGTEKNTTITVKVAAPSIASIVTPEPITVANGTSLAQLKVKLPAGVLVHLSNGALSGVDVTWDTSSYDGNVSKETVYTFKGVLEGTNLTTSIDVKVGAPSIIYVMQPSSITVEAGTSLTSLQGMLPKTVEVFMTNSLLESAKVTWNTSAYDPTSREPKTYVLTGTVEGTTKTASINISTIVVNEAAPYIVSVTAPQPITAYVGTDAKDLDLPTTVQATWSNGITTSVAVVWDTTGYNGNVEDGASYTFMGRIPGTTITTSIKVIVAALWTLVWSDEFDRSGTNLDTNGLDLDKWGYQIGTGAEYGLDGWGNNEQEYYTKNNIEVKNDTLIITPKMESVGGKPYTSGRIWTSPTYAKKYGKIEARIKMPVGQGFWPAFWMMPKNDVYGGWASSGELDIMEAIGHQPDHVNGTIHYGGSWPNNKYTGGTYYFEEGTGIGDYHTYAVEWEPGEIRWLVDGVVYHVQNNWYTNGSDGDEKYAFPAPYDQEFYIILNLAVGGNYVGNLVPGAEEFEDNPTMEVDYVRVYELTGRPYKTPVEPKLDVEELPEGARPHQDEEGNALNLVYDTNFENGIKDNAEGVDADFGDGWNYVHNAQFGGKATVTVEEIDGRNYAKVDVINVGNQNYSVQLEQHTTLGKGRWYEFSFDAKADKNRTIVTKLGGGSTVGWAVYSDTYTINLTSEIQSFKKVFQMTKDTDILTRIEFNCATTTGPVWIGNVRLVEIDPPSVDPNKSKDPLPKSGNHVYNGAFDKYTIDRLAYWTLNTSADATATMFVPETTRELNVNIVKGGNAAEDVTVEQGAIQLTKNSEYLLTFKAKAAADRTAKVKLTSKDGSTIFAEREINLTTSYTTFELPFTMGNITDMESNLVFMFGGNDSTIFLDDVKLIKTSVDYTDVDLYPLKNGDFANGFTAWEQFTQGAGANFAVENGAAKITATTLGNEAWNIMLMQGGMSIKRGIEYTFSFKAKASVNRDILVTMENASYARAFDSGSIQLTNEWQTFTYTIKPTADDVVTLKYQLGKTTAAAVGDIYIDDVIFQVKNPPYKQAPMLIADAADNVVGNVIDITFIDNTEWREAITAIKVNGTTLAADKYTVSEGVISFSGYIFVTAGSYTITVEADGYVPASVAQAILPNDGNLVINGDMSNGKAPWLIWSHDSSSAFEIKDGAAEITIYSIATENWSTQFYQEGIQLSAGKTYLLSFRAWSTVDRPIRVEYTNIGGDRLFNITSDETTVYTGTITPAADGSLKLNFCIGNVTNGSETTPNVVHKIYIDDVKVKEATGGDPIIEVKDTNIIAHGVNLVNNGDFTTNTASWESWWGDEWAGFADGTVTAEEGKMKISLTSIGGASYAPQVFQQGIHLENGKTYVVSFKAKAGVARRMNVNIGKALTADPWFTNYAPTKVIDLTTTEQQYTFAFTVTEPTFDNIKMVFEVGNVTGGAAVTDIYLDDISIQVIADGSTAPSVNKTHLAAKISEAEAKVEANYTADSWATLQTALTNAKAVNSKEDATQSEVDAAVTALTDAIVALVPVTLPGNSNLVVNGDFAAGIAPWDSWSDGYMEKSVVDGEAKIHINGFGLEPWSVQFIQTDFNFEPNVKYNLTFKARASLGRSFGVVIKGAGNYRYLDVTDNLTTDMNSYSYEFTVTKSETTKMIFFFGNTGEDITDALRGTPHTIYLDDVVIIKAVDDTPTEPSIITVEAEDAISMDDCFTKDIDSISSSQPGTFTFEVEVPEEGEYSVTIFAKCSPNGLYCELKNNTGVKIGDGASAPSENYVQITINVTLAAGVNNLSLFCAPGANSTVTIDKITFELQ